MLNSQLKELFGLSLDKLRWHSYQTGPQVADRGESCTIRRYGGGKTHLRCKKIPKDLETNENKTNNDALDQSFRSDRTDI
uniref:Uncharacterized protein n=1 Tax=Megaselia scalaris TaxID=36166 RepID=T1GLK7_MEGSC